MYFFQIVIKGELDMKLVRKYLNTAINNPKKKVLILSDVSDSYYSNEIADIILECYASL